MNPVPERAPVVIRSLTPADAAAFAALRREALRNAPWAFAAGEESDVGVNASIMAERLLEPGQAIVGAYRDGVLVGVAGLVRNRHAKMSHRANVWGVYVTPTARGRGVAEAMMRGVLDVVRGWPGVTSVGLQVSARAEGARRLYERLGFKQWGVEPGALMWEGETIDEAHMVLWLNGCVLERLI